MAAILGMDGKYGGAVKLAIRLARIQQLYSSIPKGKDAKNAESTDHYSCCNRLKYLSPNDRDRYLCAQNRRASETTECVKVFAICQRN